MDQPFLQSVLRSQITYPGQPSGCEYLTRSIARSIARSIEVPNSVCSMFAHGNRSFCRGPNTCLLARRCFLLCRLKSIFFGFDRCRCFARGAPKGSNVGRQYRLINIGRIAVADSILISAAPLSSSSLRSRPHHVSFSVRICLLHPLRKRSTHASYARHLVRGKCEDWCYGSDGSVYCHEGDSCGGCHECGPSSRALRLSKSSSGRGF